MARDFVLLKRAVKEGGLACATSEAEQRIARRLSRRDLVELARGFGVFSDHFAITTKGREVLRAHTMTTERLAR